jgi:hypothetical protein
LSPAVAAIHQFYREGCPRCGKGSPKEIVDGGEDGSFVLVCLKCKRREELRVDAKVKEPA